MRDDNISIEKNGVIKNITNTSTTSTISNSTTAARRRRQNNNKYNMMKETDSPRLLIRRLIRLFVVLMGGGFGITMLNMQHMAFPSPPPLVYRTIAIAGGQQEKTPGASSSSSYSTTSEDEQEKASVIMTPPQEIPPALLSLVDPTSVSSSASFSASIPSISGASIGAEVRQQEELPSYQQEMHKWTSFFPDDIPTRQSVSSPPDEATDAIDDTSEDHDNDATIYYRNRSEIAHKFNSTIQIVFTIGLEGTGHHLMKTIAKHSPAVRRLKNFAIWSPRVVGALQDLLWNQAANDNATIRPGVWNAHCTDRHIPVSKIENYVVRRLRGIESIANEKLVLAKKQQQQLQQQEGLPENTVRTTLPLPINAANAGAEKYGEVSYPNFLGPCRPLNYPDLNLLYNACHKAKVDCLHVYIHRHPLEILNSVVRRGFSTPSASSMQIYIADLHVMANQIRMYASQTLGCFDFFSEDPNDKYWMQAQKDLWAWDDAEEHQFFMDSVYKKPNHTKTEDSRTNDERLEELLAESPDAPYLQSWWDSHQQVVRQCREAVKNRNKDEGTAMYD